MGSRRMLEGLDQMAHAGSHPTFLQPPCPKITSPGPRILISAPKSPNPHLPTLDFAQLHQQGEKIGLGCQV